MTTDPQIGRLLSNRYQLIELVGKGAMGRVYRAEDVLLGAVIAVKFLSQTLLSPKMRDRFKAEARTCAQLGQKSIHIVRVTDYGVNDEDIPFYVMEYLQGKALAKSSVLSRFHSLNFSAFRARFAWVCNVPIKGSWLMAEFAQSSTATLSPATSW